MIIRSWDLWLQTCPARWSREPRWWRACDTTPEAAAIVTKVTVGQYVKLQVWTNQDLQRPANAGK